MKPEDTKAAPAELQISALVAGLRGKAEHDLFKAANASRGSVARVAGYQTLDDCLHALRLIEDSGGATLGPALRTLAAAQRLLVVHTATFEPAFAKGGSEAARLAYAAAVAALFGGTSLLIARGLRFDLSQSGSCTISVDAAGAQEVAQSVLVTRLASFVEMAERFGFQRRLVEEAPLVEHHALNEVFGLVTGLVGAATLLVALLFVARDVAELWYRLRGRSAAWLELQARFLEMNAATLGRADVRGRQEDMAARLRSLAERVRVDDASAERGLSSASRSAAPAEGRLLGAGAGLI